VRGDEGVDTGGTHERRVAQVQRDPGPGLDGSGEDGVELVGDGEVDLASDDHDGMAIFGDDMGVESDRLRRFLVREHDGLLVRLVAGSFLSTQERHKDFTPWIDVDDRP
jgi:hypothetical protein